MNTSDSYSYLNDTVLNSYDPALLDFAAACCVVFAIVGITGNLVSAVALAMCPKLRNATTVFIVNLCVADFLFCGFSLPLSAITFLEKQWNYGETLCKLFPLFRYSNAAVSIFSIIAITFNRYVLVVYPHKYSSIYNTRNLVLMVALMWISSLLLFSLPLFEVWGRFGFDPKVGTCSILPLNHRSPKMYLYALAFGLPSVIFIVCYSRIYCVVRQSSNKFREKRANVDSAKTMTFRRTFCGLSKIFQTSKIDLNSSRTSPPQSKPERKDLRVLRVMLVIFITFVICYFPVSFVKILKKEGTWPFLNVMGYLGVYFSSCVNPIIYIVMSEEYRLAYKGLFSRLFSKTSKSSSRPLYFIDMSSDSFRYIENR